MTYLATLDYSPTLQGSQSSRRLKHLVTSHPYQWLRRIYYCMHALAHLSFSTYTIQDHLFVKRCYLHHLFQLV